MYYRNMGKGPQIGASRHAKNPHAVALGRMGGLKGGRARAAKLTPEQLTEQGRKAVMVRWAKAKRRRSKPSVA